MKTIGTCLTRSIYLLSALLLAATGCGGGRHETVYVSSPAPYTPPASATPSADGTYDLTLYWSFERHVFGQAQPVVVYDASPGPGGTASGSCSQSGVDTIVVSDSDGKAVYSVDCVYQGVQGASYPGFAPGTYSLTVTGYRNGVALYDAPVTATISPDAPNTFDVPLSGMPDDLDVYASFVEPYGTYSTCADPTDMLSYTLIDSAGTTVDSGTAYCADQGGVLFDPAGISFQGSDALDRDTYSIQMQELYASGAVRLDSSSTPAGCAVQTFNHLGPDTATLGWTVELYPPIGACQPQ